MADKTLNAQPVDVLAWLDSLHATEANGAVTNDKWQEAQVARAAVAELVEAAKEYRAIHGRPAFGLDRLGAALARIGGAA